MSIIRYAKMGGGRGGLRGLLLAVVCCLTLSVSAQNVWRDTVGYESPVTVIENMPVFWLGDVTGWIHRHVYYPEEALARGVEGKVFVQFTIDSTGRVTNPRMLREEDPDLFRAARALILSMPRWSPATKNGKAISVSYTVPVTFSLWSVPPYVPPTYDLYMEQLKEREANLGVRTEKDSVSEGLYETLLNYIYRHNSRVAYKAIYKETKTRQQTTEIMLGASLPKLDMPNEKKAAILKAYKDEWEEEIRLIDSLPAERFTDGYARLYPRLRDNATRRELGLLDLLGEKGFKAYVETCVLNRGKLLPQEPHNPLVGMWMLLSRGGKDPEVPVYKDWMEDGNFLMTSGERGTYQLVHGRFYEERVKNASYRSVVSYVVRCECTIQGNLLLMNGKVVYQMADGTSHTEDVQEVWRRVDGGN